MRVLRLLTVAGIALALAAATAPAQEKEKGKGKDKGRPGIRGVVKSVTRDKGATGTIVIMVREGRGKTGKGKTEEKTIKVTSSTRFFKVSKAGKGSIHSEPASFNDVKKGERVQVVLAEGKTDEAARVAIMARGVKVKGSPKK